MSSAFSDRHIWITGASSGIGAALARDLAVLDGARVSLSARRADRLEALVAEIEGAGGRAAAFPLDVCDATAIGEVHRRAVEAFGPVDIVIANAGVDQGGKTFHRTPPEAVVRILQVNLIGALATIGAVLPAMIERGQGQVVGISSLASYRGLPRASVYCASKAGLSAFLEALRIEVRSKGLSVTDICPGFIATEMTADVDFPMPLLMSAERGSKLMRRAIRKRTARYGFPWRMHALMRLGQMMPRWMWVRMMGSQVRGGGAKGAS